MTHIKACGFTTLDPMVAAAKAGVDSIGLVMIPGLKRSLSVRKAQTLLTSLDVALKGHPKPEIVGLFGGQSSEEVNKIASKLNMDSVQLCSDESMSFCSEMALPIYKVIGVNPDIPINSQLPRIMVIAQRHSMAGHRIVLDSKPTALDFGGTGRKFDWEIAGQLAEAFDIQLAGGLNPDNIAEAIKTVKPWGIDTSSGIETDGEKDVKKVIAFIKNAQEADEAAKVKGFRKVLRSLF